MNLVLSFWFFLRTERTNNAAETNKGKEIIGKSTVRKALLTTMLRGIVSTALSRNIFSPKAAKKQLCEQRKERRGGKKEKNQVKSHHPHEHLYTWC